MSEHQSNVGWPAGLEPALPGPQPGVLPLGRQPQGAAITIQCIWCGSRVNDVAGRRGRPRLWCGAGCRNKAYRARLILADGASAGGNGHEPSSPQ